MIDNGSATATELRSFIEDNRVDLGELINNLVTTGEVVVTRLDGSSRCSSSTPTSSRAATPWSPRTPRPACTTPTSGWSSPPSPAVQARLRRHRPSPAPGRREPTDGHGAPLRRAGLHVQRPRLAERPARRRGLPRTRGRLVRPGHENLKWVNEVPGAQRSTVRPGPPHLGEESWKWLFLQPLARPKE